jgi:release factor glutamine methyltransferase
MRQAAVVARLRAAGCVFAEEEAQLLIDAAREDGRDLDALVGRRCDGEPLEIVVGWTEFCGLRIQVDPGVFVPRHRSELLVREAVRLVRPGSVVLDLCCGSGALGAAVAAACPADVRVVAADVDERAVACARRNLAPFGGTVVGGDLDAALPEEIEGRVDILLSNVPYVPSDDVDLLPREARLHEPRHALDGGRDGLDVLRRVLVIAPRWLAAGGALLTEVSEAQVEGALAAVRSAGLQPSVAHDAELEATAVVARQSSVTL